MASSIPLYDRRTVRLHRNGDAVVRAVTVLSQRNSNQGKTHPSSLRVLASLGENTTMVFLNAGRTQCYLFPTRRLVYPPRRAVGLSSSDSARTRNAGIVGCWCGHERRPEPIERMEEYGGSYYGRTVLHHAARNHQAFRGEARQQSFLLDNGAHPNLRQYFGNENHPIACGVLYGCWGWSWPSRSRWSAPARCRSRPKHSLRSRVVLCV